MDKEYLNSIKKLFRYYKLLGEKTFVQLDEQDLFWQYNPQSNSIAIIVTHLAGNMLSRWTGFLTTDGEKEWRNRDREFEPHLTTKEAVLNTWQNGWECLFRALDTLNDSHFNQLIYIRNQAHTIPEAIDRQLAHYAYHIGQIVYIGRMIRGAEWQSLSIPKGSSEAFNAARFSKGKHGGHFSDDLS